MSNEETVNILDRILETKRKEVARKSGEVSLEEMKKRAARTEFEIRGFRQALSEQVALKKPAIIAELKKASPSKGVIRENFDIFALARAYERGHATCLSVLTDFDYFQGHGSFLKVVRESVDLPLLRKDFIIDEYQVYESRVLGADAILLIAAAMPAEKLEELFKIARSLGLDVLIEVHTHEEYESVKHLGSDAIMGVNNRDLKTFKIDTKITVEINKLLPEGQWLVCESGIHKPEQVEAMKTEGVYAFLVGEAFMRFENPSEGLATLFPELFAND